MRLALVLFFCVALSGGARSEDLYDFVVRCKADSVAACFGRIGATLDRVRAEGQGRAFCLPRVWHPAAPSARSYPVSLFDYLLLRLSAARVTRPAESHRVVLKDVLADMYPCREARR
jgi:hypothetical protein